MKNNEKANIDPYSEPPVYETDTFALRLVSMDDADDLLECYSDKAAVALMNADNCTNDFYFTSVERMREMIGFWLDAYRNRSFVRLAIAAKETGKAVGTFEMFGGDCGVLRVDLCQAYEREDCLAELFSLAVRRFYRDFQAGNIVFRTSPDAVVRLRMLDGFGFKPTDEFRAGRDYFMRRNIPTIAYCGLACCVCSERDGCDGCQSGGCEGHADCKNFNCCRDKGLDGCFDCDSFPCGGCILDKPRIRAFARFAKLYGADKLTECLFRNRQRSVLYHYAGRLVGDYDNCESEAEIFYMIKTGVAPDKTEETL